MADPTYAGDVDPKKAWDILAQDPKAVLIDVRTRPEWNFVGAPDLSSIGKQAAFIEWQAYPDLQLNPRFAAEVETNGVPKDAPILLLCRSGARSKSAAIALTKLGYKTCYNISDGFEGPKDTTGHRGGAAGWKALGLPWQQG
jgi:rhodanese-related sulfurtransferase